MARKFRELMADWSAERTAAVEAGAREMLPRIPLRQAREVRNRTQALDARVEPPERPPSAA